MIRIITLAMGMALSTSALAVAPQITGAPQLHITGVRRYDNLRTVRQWLKPVDWKVNKPKNVFLGYTRTGLAYPKMVLRDFNTWRKTPHFIQSPVVERVGARLAGSVLWGMIGASAAIKTSIIMGIGLGADTLHGVRRLITAPPQRLVK